LGRIIAWALVDNPETVSVREILWDRTVVFELRVANGDLARSSENRNTKQIGGNENENA